ncbi:hypothetical protein EDB89DRAFT_1963556 [Lactarius sanguifluus]|nr:hypothetical protein EDB89DRAFT_1963556 [Lactarius sanguifluus]
MTQMRPTLLVSRVHHGKPLRFSGITYEKLEDFNITPHSRVELSLKPGHEKRAAVASLRGKEELWSSTGLHRHLEALQQGNLQGLVRNVNKESACRWIEPFFFRVSTMVLSNTMRMVLSPEQVVQQTAVNPSSSKTLSGCIGYTAVIADNGVANVFLSDPTFRNLCTMPCGFFVAVANIELASLMEHVPQAIGEMYACAKSLKVDTLRGALTDGNSWMFLIIGLNPDGHGANFRHSTPIEFRWGMPSQIVKPWPDVLAGILLHWIENSFSDIGGDDWFENSN